jgi:hypothetical protein
MFSTCLFISEEPVLLSSPNNFKMVVYFIGKYGEKINSKITNNGNITIQLSTQATPLKTILHQSSLNYLNVPQV